MDEKTRQRVKTIALGIAAALLFTRAVLGPGTDVRHLVGLLVAAGVTIPFTWYVMAKANDAAERQERFSDLGRFFVVSFLLYLLAGAGVRAVEGGVVTLDIRLALLVPSVIVAYVLGFKALYRPVFSRFKDVWVKELSEEEQRELESLREDE